MRYVSDEEKGVAALGGIKITLEARFGDGAITLENLVRIERDSDQDSARIALLLRKVPIAWAIRVIVAGGPRKVELIALSDWAFERHERMRARLEAARDLPQIEEEGEDAPVTIDVETTIEDAGIARELEEKADDAEARLAEGDEGFHWPMPEPGEVEAGFIRPAADEGEGGG